MTLDKLTRRRFMELLAGGGATGVALRTALKSLPIGTSIAGSSLSTAGCSTPTEPEEDKIFVELRTETTYQSLRISKLEYAIGEEVTFEYKAEGIPWPVLVEWYIYQGDKEIYYPYYYHTFSLITNSVTNASSNVFNGSWNQKNNDGIQVPADKYTLYVGKRPLSKDYIHLNFRIK